MEALPKVVRPRLLGKYRPALIARQARQHCETLGIGNRIMLAQGSRPTMQRCFNIALFGQQGMPCIPGEKCGRG